MLWEDIEDRQRLPTAANILQGLRWLLSDLQPGDSLFFHYSGEPAAAAGFGLLVAVPASCMGRW